MVRPDRRVWVAMLAASALYFGAFSSAALHVSAQAAGPAPTPAQAAPFVGDLLGRVLNAEGGFVVKFPYERAGHHCQAAGS